MLHLEGKTEVQVGKAEAEDECLAFWFGRYYICTHATPPSISCVMPPHSRRGCYELATMMVLPQFISAEPQSTTPSHPSASGFYCACPACSAILCSFAVASDLFSPCLPPCTYQVSLMHPSQHTLCKSCSPFPLSTFSDPTG